MALNPELLIPPPPDDATVARTLAEFAAAVRAHYGERLKGIYLFGSRARGDHHPESDADIAVVLADGDWIGWKERRALTRLAYDLSLETGLEIQPWPFDDATWADAAAPKPLVVAARHDARPL
jgi:predicted nucleotidyltransferase